MIDAGVIYFSRERAQDWADVLNFRKGHCPSWVILTDHGWSLVCSWRPVQEDQRTKQSVCCSERWISGKP